MVVLRGRSTRSASLRAKSEHAEGLLQSVAIFVYQKHLQRLRPEPKVQGVVLVAVASSGASDIGQYKRETRNHCSLLCGYPFILVLQQSDRTSTSVWLPVLTHSHLSKQLCPSKSWQWSPLWSSSCRFIASKGALAFSAKRNKRQKAFPHFLPHFKRWLTHSR